MAIGEADNGNHHPGPADDERWQESWFLLWVDPENRAGGFHHLAQWRNLGIADVWSWIALDGEVVGKYQNLELPIPDSDLSGIAIGGLEIKTTEPLRAVEFGATYQQASCELAYRAHDNHIEEYVLSPTGASIGDNHYESFGGFSGAIDLGSERREVSGVAFQDHSWGARDMGKLLTERSVIVSFGEDLYGQILVWTTAEGPTAFGYICDGGTSRPITSAETNTVVADDGHSPVRCDIRAAVEGGKDYRIEGEVYVSSVSSHREGFFITDGLAEFRCGDRTGSGLLEVMELKGPAPWHRALLGLEAESETGVIA